jgi:solute carrier family 25 oxoglutarate transporter 11
MQAKEMLQEAGFKGQAPVLGGALIAGVVASAFSLPFDYVKTQLQVTARQRGCTGAA